MAGSTFADIKFGKNHVGFHGMDFSYRVGGVFPLLAVRLAAVRLRSTSVVAKRVLLALSNLSGAFLYHKMYFPMNRVGNNHLPLLAALPCAASAAYFLCMGLRI